MIDRTALEEIRRQPLFLFGLILRLAIVLLAVPETYGNWFLPFLQNSFTFPAGLDPWTTHLATSGDTRAFPYGLVMYLTLLPQVAVGTFFDHMAGTEAFAQIGLGLTILMLDIALLAILCTLQPARPDRLVSLYWLSPIVIYICYWHGQLDIVPVVFLMLSILFIKRRQAALSGGLMAAAMSAKLSMLIAPPFLVLYLYLDSRLRKLVVRFSVALAVTFAALQTPLLLSDAARNMVFATPEMTKVYDISLRLSDGLEIYFLPIVFLGVLYAAWSVGRISFDLLLALIGVGFTVTVLMTPASPGWYLWLVPFMVLIFNPSRLRMRLLVALFAVVFVGFHLIRSSGAEIPLAGLDFTVPLAVSFQLYNHLLSVWLSVLVAIGCVVCVLLMREGILRNDHFRLSRRPLLIGIAGDSGSGKDTLVAAIIDILGNESVAHISGDDYHLWDRDKPMWQVITHLNPRANDLTQYKQDVLSLADGRGIRSRHYDHSTGAMSRPHWIAPQEVIITSGLHALFDRNVCQRCDVCIYLDMNRELNRTFKIKRDTTRRGHLVADIEEAIEKRSLDHDRFVRPQINNADLVLALEPLNPTILHTHEIDEQSLKLRIRVQLNHDTPYEHLVRTLVAVCGLHVDVDLNDLNGPVEIAIEGDVVAEDIELAAATIAEDLEHLLSLEPIWLDGPLGLMQLFVLNQIVHNLRRRLS